MARMIRPAFSLLLLMTLLCGFLYPGAVWLAGRAFFPEQAQGSPVRHNGRIVGSALIGQSFVSPAFFDSRPSASATRPYNPLASGASQLSPGNPALIGRVKERIAHFRKDNLYTSVPADLVTDSASGLDPHITPEAALFQVRRIAAARRLNPERIVYLIKSSIEPPTFGFLGQARVNVLKLNLALDSLAGGAK